MEDRVRQIQGELAALVSEVGRRRFGERAWAGSISIPMELEADATGRWRVCGRPLLEMVEDALREAAAQAAPLQPSRAFCHRCETSACAHAVPPGPQQVFAGYGQTGLPTWGELGQVLLYCSHPDVDRLYGDRGALLTQVMAGRDLKSKQLAAFGRSSKSHDVLGQVVAGYYTLRTPGAPSADRLALTFQAVEHRGTRREIRLDLNVLGRTSAGEDAVPLLSEKLGERLTEPIGNARDALHEVQLRLREREVKRNRKLRSEAMRRVPAILRKLARDLTLADRRRQRRTAHAEQRRKQSRPVQAAAREAQRCVPERTFFDEHEGTIVVLGRRNRVHVFAPDGRLVTSLSMEADGVERRQRQGRWRRVSADELAEFRSKLEPASDE